MEGHVDIIFPPHVLGSVMLIAFALVVCLFLLVLINTEIKR